MRVLIMKPDCVPAEREIDGSLTSMQELVGGCIEAIYPFEEEIALVTHGEGKLLGLPLNRALRDERTGEIYDIIAGTCFLCGAPTDAESFTSLTEEQVQKYQKRFRYPEMFFELNGQIVAVPVKKV